MIPSLNFNDKDKISSQTIDKISGLSKEDEALVCNLSLEFRSLQYICMYMEIYDYICMSMYENYQKERGEKKKKKLLDVLGGLTNASSSYS